MEKTTMKEVVPLDSQRCKSKMSRWECPKHTPTNVQVQKYFYRSPLNDENHVLNFRQNTRCRRKSLSNVASNVPELYRDHL